jgi:hypothetical protein
MSHIKIRQMALLATFDKPGASSAPFEPVEGGALLAAYLNK